MDFLKVDFNINDPTAYFTCSIYSIPVFPYFVKLNCVNNSTFAPAVIFRKYYLFHFFKIGYLDYTSFNFVQK